MEYDNWSRVYPQEVWYMNCTPASPKVSVVMPVYNVENTFLCDAIKSILNQSFSDFELIIIDDCSSSDVELVVRRFSDKRIQYFRNDTNKGIAASLNRGITFATGKYIARMDGDDVSLPDRLLRQVMFLDAHSEISLVGTNYEVIGTQRVSDQPEKVTFLTLLKGCYIAHPSVMWRKKDFDRYLLRYDDSLPCAQDYELWSRAIHHIKIANMPDVLLQYRIHENSVSQVKGKKQDEIARQVQNRMLAFLTNDNIQRERIRAEVWSKKRKSSKLCLFGFIPLLTIKRRNNKNKFMLFGFIPLLEVIKR